MSDCHETARRFMASSWIRGVWPEGLRARSLGAFPFQCVFEDDYVGRGREHLLRQVYWVLTRSDLRTLVILLLGSDPATVEIARAQDAAGQAHPEISRHMGIAAMANRDYAEAGRRFKVAQQGGAAEPDLPLFRALALGLAGQREEALRAVEEFHPTNATQTANRDWLASFLGRLHALR